TRPSGSPPPPASPIPRSPSGTRSGSAPRPPRLSPDVPYHASKSGHHYFGEKRTFVLCVDMQAHIGAMADTVGLTMGELDRLQVMTRIAERRLTRRRVAALLGLSERQTRRLRAPA